MEDADSKRYQHEINHLKQTILALRRELEKKQLEINTRLQSTKQAASEQINQLEKTIQQMRLRVEEEHSARESDVLRATKSLREQLRQERQESESLRRQLLQVKNDG